MKAQLHAIEADARVFGIRKVRLGHTHVVRWAVACDCGRERLHGWQPQTSPALMVRNLRRQHWRIEAHRAPVCASCQEKERRP